MSKKKTTKSITLGHPRYLSVADCAIVARSDAKIRLSPSLSVRMERSRKVLSQLTREQTPIYGLTTHFGSQVTFLDPNLGGNSKSKYAAGIAERQRNLILSHNIGLGPQAPEEVSRVAMMLRAQCLGTGYSGVRPIVVRTLTSLINAGIHPIIHRYGSIGASGDLIPLSAIAAAVTGQAVPVKVRGKLTTADKALKIAGIKPLVLQGREGLSLINGTSYLTSIAVLSANDLNRLFTQMLSAISLSLEALMILDSGYNPLVHELKHHEGEKQVNSFLLKFWRGSKLIQKLSKVRTTQAGRSLQDYYSLRSVAQGFGPLQESLSLAIRWIEEEANAVSDNPIVDPDSNNVHHAANFMGYYVTSACDILKNEIAQASSWLHAILANLVHPRKNSGLPANLISDPGRYNGFRPMQILAASLVVQNRKLAQSQQAYMIPTEGDNQDVNSLAAHAAWDLREAVDNLERIVAILLLAAVQAVEFRGVKLAGKKGQALHALVRSKSPKITHDRDFAKDIEKVILLLRTQDK